MTFELGPRTVYYCELKHPGCKAKTHYYIVKKILTLEGKTFWACDNCLRRESNARQIPGHNID